MEAAIAALRDRPEQHPVAREDALVDVTVRQIVYGLGRKPTHRAVFRVRDDKVVRLCGSASASAGSDAGGTRVIRHTVDSRLVGSCVHAEFA